jgi:type I restriction enzyme, S subunit
MIASANYDQFTISPNVNGRFFWWLSHSPNFRETVRSSAFGVVIEKMVFNRDAWLDKKLPLPPMDEQRRIVARIEELLMKIQEARVLRQQAEEEAESLLTNQTSRVFDDLTNNPKVPQSHCRRLIRPQRVVLAARWVSRLRTSQN